MASPTFPAIKNLESLRKQLVAAFASLFSTANSYTAVQTFPAGGIVIGTVKVLSGAGSPEGAVAAPVGSLYLRTNGGGNTTLYVKEANATAAGWVAK